MKCCITTNPLSRKPKHDTNEVGIFMGTNFKYDNKAKPHLNVKSPTETKWLHNVELTVEQLAKCLDNGFCVCPSLARKTFTRGDKDPYKKLYWHRYKDVAESYWVYVDWESKTPGKIPFIIDGEDFLEGFSCKPSFVSFSSNNIEGNSRGHIFWCFDDVIPQERYEELRELARGDAKNAFERIKPDSFEDDDSITYDKVAYGACGNPQQGFGTYKTYSISEFIKANVHTNKVISPRTQRKQTRTVKPKRKEKHTSGDVVWKGVVDGMINYIVTNNIDVTLSSKGTHSNFQHWCKLGYSLAETYGVDEGFVLFCKLSQFYDGYDEHTAEYTWTEYIEKNDSQCDSKTLYNLLIDYVPHSVVKQLINSNRVPGTIQTRQILNILKKIL